MEGWIMRNEDDDYSYDGWCNQKLGVTVVKILDSFILHPKTLRRVLIFRENQDFLVETVVSIDSFDI